MLWRFVQENLMQFACLLIVYTKVEIEAINFNSSTDVDALEQFPNFCYMYVLHSSHHQPCVYRLLYRGFYTCVVHQTQCTCAKALDRRWNPVKYKLECRIRMLLKHWTWNVLPCLWRLIFAEFQLQRYLTAVGNKWRHPWNRKYITYRYATPRGLSHGHI